MNSVIPAPPQGLLDFLKSKDNFLIAVHIDPDGDCLGSGIALSSALEQLGKKATLLSENPISEQYTFLPGYEAFHTFEALEQADMHLRDFNALILVDCNAISRITTTHKQFFIENFKGTAAVIDHHETESSFGDVRWILPEIPATGMLIFSVIQALGVEMTEKMAVNLYAALVVDTGNFRFDNVTPDVFLVAAALQEAGARPAVIYRELYESWSEARMRLFIKVLNTLEIKGEVGIVYATKSMFRETGAMPADTENFVSFPRTIRALQASVFLREVDENHYKVSLRSKGEINVAHVAERFGGGGHKNAAGCVIKTDLETAKSQLLEALKNSVRHQ